jgi:hypothetical protein
MGWQGFYARVSPGGAASFVGFCVSAANPVTNFSRPEITGGWPTPAHDSYLVDSASSHMLVLKIKPCMSKYKQLYSETANGSLNQLSFI